MIGIVFSIVETVLSRILVRLYFLFNLMFVVDTVSRNFNSFSVSSFSLHLTSYFSIASPWTALCIVTV